MTIALDHSEFSKKKIVAEIGRFKKKMILNYFGVYRMCFLLMAVFIIATNSRLKRSPIILFLLLEDRDQCVYVRGVIRISYIFLSFFATESPIISFIVMTIKI